MDSDHQLEFQTQVCIYPVPGKLRTLPPASFLASSPALPVQTCCDPVTPLPPAAGVLCPITFLHSRGGRLWPPPLCGIVTHHHTGISTSMPLFQRHPPPQSVHPAPVLAHGLLALQGPSPLLSPTGGCLGLLQRRWFPLLSPFCFSQDQNSWHLSIVCLAGITA